MRSNLAAYRSTAPSLVDLDLDAGLVDRPPMVQLADWRRRMFELYAAVRATDDPEAAWRL